MPAHGQGRLLRRQPGGGFAPPHRHSLPSMCLPATLVPTTPGPWPPACTVGAPLACQPGWAPAPNQCPAKAQPCGGLCTGTTKGEGGVGAARHWRRHGTRNGAHWQPPPTPPQFVWRAGTATQPTNQGRRVCGPNWPQLAGPAGATRASEPPSGGTRPQPPCNLPTRRGAAPWAACGLHPRAPKGVWWCTPAGGIGALPKGWVAPRGAGVCAGHMVSTRACPPSNAQHGHPGWLLRHLRRQVQRRVGGTTPGTPPGQATALRRHKVSPATRCRCSCGGRRACIWWLPTGPRYTCPWWMWWARCGHVRCPAPAKPTHAYTGPWPSHGWCQSQAKCKCAGPWRPSGGCGRGPGHTWGSTQVLANRPQNGHVGHVHGHTHSGQQAAWGQMGQAHAGRPPWRGQGWAWGHHAHPAQVRGRLGGPSPCPVRGPVGLVRLLGNAGRHPTAIARAWPPWGHCWVCPR